MSSIVRIALARPYTFVVLALVILLLGPIAALRTPTDIFPNINIPIVAVAWTYTGLPPDQMAGRITTPFQRALTTTVNDIEHIEASSVTGFGIVKIYFHRNADINLANAQVTAIAQTMIKQMPPGAVPPLIVNYSASTVPILQLALSGKGLSEQALADFGMNTLRTRLVTVQGAAVPWPFGGKSRQIQIDLDPAALAARNLTAQDVANALAAGNLVVPAGTQKIGATEYTVSLNNSPAEIDEIGALPVKVVNGTLVSLRDVASVRDGNAVQSNIVHVDGGRSVLVTIFKNGATSTLDIIDGIKRMVEEVRPQFPAGFDAKPVGDQSLFVRNAVGAVVKEGVIAAALTSLMILLFLGSARSTLIVTLSIPLSILGAVIGLAALGQTLNIMTLGGLALAVGILVDEATVTVESINYHLEQGKGVTEAILDGAQQIVVPAFVSLLCICIVFVPMYFLDGVARFLFVPLAEAVILAMACSFLLSRTLVPTLAKYWLRAHVPGAQAGDDPAPSWPRRFQRGFEARFATFRSGYRDLLALAIARRRVFLAGFSAAVALSFLLTPMLGRNFFPDVDAGQMLLHVRAPIGTRVEETSARFAEVEAAIRETIPPAELATVVDNIGSYISSINTIYNNTGSIGQQDGDIQISLAPGHAPTAGYIRRLREELPRRFPGLSFSFLPADIVSQILNFGAPAPVDLQIRGPKLAANFAYANELLAEIRRIPGVADAHLQQSMAAPVLNVAVDRSRAAFAGMSERDVTSNLGLLLSGSGQTAPAFWLNPANGVNYPIVMQAPQYQIDSLDKLEALPVNAPGAPSAVLGGIATISRGSANAVVSQYDIQSLVQIYATPQDRDLGAIAADIQKVIDAHAAGKPKGSTVALVGQVRTMNSAYTGLLTGLVGAIVLIYLLIVVNFQSWTDPLVIIGALPAALAGIVWMLFATGTTLSVPALTGAIMCMGVATANSVLVISFAREQLAAGLDPVDAALEAGYVRLRPVLMTALAMIIGMLPMALGLGEGGEQNAPLGRAVIGGLAFATVATLLFVPVLFSVVHQRKRARSAARAVVPGVAHVAR